jgi:hypothetical protein
MVVFMLDDESRCPECGGYGSWFSQGLNQWGEVEENAGPCERCSASGLSEKARAKIG